MIVNIGYIDEASGDVQPMSDNITENPALTKVKPASQPDENIATQDIEESPKRLRIRKKQISKESTQQLRHQEMIERLWSL